MELSAILEAVDRRPFTQFILEMDDGRKVRVRDPSCVVFSPSRANVWYIQVRDPVLDEDASLQPSAVKEILPLMEDECQASQRHYLARAHGPGYDDVVEFRTLRDALEKRPFEPFTIELRSGRKIHVRDPSTVLFIPSRAKVWDIQAYDPLLDDGAWFHPSVVRELLPFTEDGGAAR